MPIIVQKFGGTSVANAEKIRVAARRAIRAQQNGNQVVMVVSAMGHQTDVLVDLAKQITDDPSGREMDMLLSTGEQVSVALMAMAIHSLGAGAVILTGAQIGIRTDSSHTKARIQSISTERMRKLLDDGKIVIAAGFQGIDEDFNITTLGRGGSDTTAVALAAVLNADACEIYTDVDGVFTADPRIVPDARKLHAVSYEEMLEMAASGARVLALRSVEFARNHGVKLHVRSTFTEENGTWITEEDERMLEKAMISGVTHTLEEAVYRVEGVERADLFSALAEAPVSVDTIIQTDGPILFSAPVEDREQTAAVLDRLGAKWNEQDGLGKVSVIGAGMKSHPGIAARTFATLRDLGLEPQLVATSPIKIAFYVPQDEVERAVKGLHDA